MFFRREMIVIIIKMWKMLMRSKDQYVEGCAVTADAINCH